MQLGRTGVRVSAITLGTATFGVAPDAELAKRMVARALDLGVNMFDCANSYGDQPRFDRPGAPPAHARASAEEILGQALRGRRDEVVLCSKVMEPVGPGVNDRGLSRLHIFNQVEASLRRLGADHLDVYYAHHPDPTTPLDETLRAFDDLVRQGKIRYVALSTHPAIQVVEALWICDRLRLSAPVANQVPYNLATRGLERDMVPACARHGVSLTVFSPLAGGLLAGPQTRSRTYTGAKRWGGQGFSQAQLQLADELQAVAEEAGHAPAELALGWLLAQPAVASAIVGPETLDELEASAAAADLILSEEVLARVDAIGKPPAAMWGL
jgi:aryl-alcohol dehydrogenase-like predicted oxidoreductase